MTDFAVLRAPSQVLFGCGIAAATGEDKAAAALPFDEAATPAALPFTLAGSILEAATRGGLGLLWRR